MPANSNFHLHISYRGWVDSLAVTSLWHVKGSIKDVIDYIENPEKTVPNQDMQDFFDVFSYVKNPLKTNEGEYVSAINCLKETALQQMILTKKQYQKTGGYIAWHGYQSSSQTR